MIIINIIENDAQWGYSVIVSFNGFKSSLGLQTSFNLKSYLETTNAAQKAGFLLLCQYLGNCMQSLKSLNNTGSLRQYIRVIVDNSDHLIGLSQMKQIESDADQIGSLDVKALKEAASYVLNKNFQLINL
jgi:hypothetical protein